MKQTQERRTAEEQDWATAMCNNDEHNDELHTFAQWVHLDNQAVLFLFFCFLAFSVSSNKFFSSVEDSFSSIFSTIKFFTSVSSSSKFFS